MINSNTSYSNTYSYDNNLSQSTANNESQADNVLYGSSKSKDKGDEELDGGPTNINVHNDDEKEKKIELVDGLLEPDLNFMAWLPDARGRDYGYGFVGEMIKHICCLKGTGYTTCRTKDGLTLWKVVEDDS